MSDRYQQCLNACLACEHRLAMPVSHATAGGKVHTTVDCAAKAPCDHSDPAKPVNRLVVVGGVSKCERCPLDRWPKVETPKTLEIPVLNAKPIVIRDGERADHCVHYRGVPGRNFGGCALGLYANMPVATCMKCSRREPK